MADNEHDEQRMISARLLDALAMPFGGLQELDGKTINQIERRAQVLRDIVDAMDGHRLESQNYPLSRLVIDILESLHNQEYLGLVQILFAYSDDLTRLLDALAMPFGGYHELTEKPIERIEHCAEVLRDIVDAMDAGEISTVGLQDIPPALHDLTDPDVDERWN